MKLKIAIIKLASIGDIAIAAKALIPFLDLLEKSKVSYEIHWIIDQNLQDLAQNLLHFQKYKASVVFHPFDSGHLFKGSWSEKVKQAFSLVRLVQQINPNSVLLLHRDWRYRFLLRLFLTADSAKNLVPIFNVSRSPVSEFKNYCKVFSDFAFSKGLELNLSSDIKSNEAVKNPLSISTPKKLGILVGGGNNVKSSYSEKRWPWMSDFLDLISKKYSSLFEVHLYGSAEDQITLPTDSTKFINKIGKLSLAEVASDLKNMDIFLSIDSGLAHIAAFSMEHSTQQIYTLFGPTSHHTWAPTAIPAQVTIIRSDVSCSPCNSNDGIFLPCRFQETEKETQCMKLITPEQVIECILSMPGHRDNSKKALL